MNYIISIIFFYTLACTGTNRNQKAINNPINSSIPLQRISNQKWYDTFSSRYYLVKEHPHSRHIVIYKDQNKIIDDITLFIYNASGDVNTIIDGIGKDKRHYSVSIKNMYMAYIEPEEIHYNNSVINALVKHGMRFSGIQKKHSKETVQDNLFFDILIKGTRKEKLSRIISLTKICIHTALDPLKNKNATLKKQIFSFFLCLKQIRKKLSFPIIPKPLIRDISNTAYKEHPDLKDISDALKQRSRYKEFNFNTPLEFIVNTYALTEKKYQDYNLKLFDPSFWENNCIEAIQLCAPKKILNSEKKRDNCILF